MSVYDIITKRIIDSLEKNIIPWRQDWTCQLPSNLVSKKTYNGINILLLASLKFSNPYFVTYNQATKLGGSVKKGEKGAPIIFWKMRQVAKAAKDVKAKYIPILRYYTVFNVAQCEGLETPEIEWNNKKLDSYEQVIKKYKKPPKIVLGDRASYSPLMDVVKIPDIKHFETSEGYYATLFHELVHSTGARKRLNRFSQTNYSIRTMAYGKEELVAELGSAFLCGQFGVDNSVLKNSTAYIKGWLRKLKNDSSLIIQAASKASKAANYILGD